LCSSDTLHALRAPGTLWIAADVHASAHAPATCEAFLQFLDAASTRADAVFLCGDVFDAWVGDDDACQDPAPWLAHIVAALQRTSARIPVWCMRGNRDFLLGPAFAQHVGVRLLPDPVLLQTDGGDALLAHGDQYCTDDHAYQRFRGIVRNPVVQRLYLALGLDTRRKIAAWARRRSQASTRRKPDIIMDVNAAAIVHALRASGASIMIHGHTHRPAQHAVRVDGRICQRFVLSDWDLDRPDARRMAWLQVDARGVRVSSGCDGAERSTPRQPSQHDDA